MYILHVYSTNEKFNFLLYSRIIGNFIEISNIIHLILQFFFKTDEQYFDCQRFYLN